MLNLNLMSKAAAFLLFVFLVEMLTVIEEGSEIGFAVVTGFTIAGVTCNAGGVFGIDIGCDCSFGGCFMEVIGRTIFKLELVAFSTEGFVLGWMLTCCCGGLGVITLEDVNTGAGLFAKGATTGFCSGVLVIVTGGGGSICRLSSGGPGILASGCSSLGFFVCGWSLDGSPCCFVATGVGCFVTGVGFFAIFGIG